MKYPKEALIVDYQRCGCGKCGPGLVELEEMCTWTHNGKECPTMWNGRAVESGTEVLFIHLWDCTPLTKTSRQLFESVGLAYLIGEEK